MRRCRITFLGLMILLTIAAPQGSATAVRTVSPCNRFCVVGATAFSKSTCHRDTLLVTICSSASVRTAVATRRSCDVPVLALFCLTKSLHTGHLPVQPNSGLAGDHWAGQCNPVPVQSSANHLPVIDFSSAYHITFRWPVNRVVGGGKQQSEQPGGDV